MSSFQITLELNRDAAQRVGSGEIEWSALVRIRASPRPAAAAIDPINFVEHSAALLRCVCASECGGIAGLVGHQARSVSRGHGARTSPACNSGVPALFCFVFAWF